jgi:Flp pilus assembly protein TadG
MSQRGAVGRARDHQANGQSLVEFALVIPVFLMILFAIFDFGFMAFSRLTLINATREGAHAATVQSDNSVAIDENLDSPGGPIRANAPGIVQAGLTITTTCVPAAGLSACDFTGGNATRDAQTGDSVRVRTSYSYPSMFGRFLGTTVNLSTDVRMVLE